MSIVDPALIARIKDAALNLPIDCLDSLYLDKLLGVLDNLVHDARQSIDDDWRAARQRSADHVRVAPTPSLDDLA
jgi:hypothetical protein